MPKTSIPSEYRRLFNFFFLYRAASLAIALFLILLNRDSFARWLFLAWFGFCAYTLYLYLDRKRIFDLIVSKPIYLVFDLLVAGLGLVLAHEPGNPFYFYSISPIMPVAVLYRAIGVTLAATLLSAFEPIALTVHGLPEKTVVMNIVRVFYELLTYFVVGYMAVPSKSSMSLILEHQPRQEFN